jgi:hypothetical protein
MIRKKSPCSVQMEFFLYFPSDVWLNPESGNLQLQEADCTHISVCFYIRDFCSEIISTLEHFYIGS